MRVVCPHCLSINNVPQKESYKKANCGNCKNSLLDNKPIDLNESNFDEVLVNSDVPVIVDFWAPWCGPCKTMAPTFTSTAKNYPLKVLFTKVNTQDQQNLGARFAIQSIPTLIIFKDGREQERVSGALDSGNLNALVSKYI